MIFVPLNGETHDRPGFDCGESSLNRYLQEQASQAARRFGSKTFVLVDEANPSFIIGYHTTLLAQLEITAIPEKKLGKGNLAMLLLARMAVDHRHQGRQIGRVLVIDVLKRAKAISEYTALYGVLVDALTDDVEPFYQNQGFKNLLDKERHLYITIPTIEGLLKE